MSKRKREEVKSCVTWTQLYPNQSGVPAARASRSFEQHTQDKAGQGGQTIDLETSPLSLSPPIRTCRSHTFMDESFPLVNLSTKSELVFVFPFFVHIFTVSNFSKTLEFNGIDTIAIFDMQVLNPSTNCVFAVNCILATQQSHNPITRIALCFKRCPVFIFKIPSILPQAREAGKVTHAQVYMATFT